MDTVNVKVDASILNLVKIVCPSAEELSVIINNVRCNQCGLVFQNESRFRLHDLKVHQRKNLDKIAKESIKYHCPEVSCIYSPTSQRYFTTMKYLKQVSNFNDIQLKLEKIFFLISVNFFC